MSTYRSHDGVRESALDSGLSPTTVSRGRAIVVATAPLLLLAGVLYHPYLTRLNNDGDVAAAAAETTRWGLAHLVVGLGFALSAVAFVAVGNHLREAGEHRWSVIAVPFAVIGSAIAVFLPAMEIAMVAVVNAGADVEAVLGEMTSWFVPLLLTSAVTFAIGAMAFAAAVVRADILSPRMTRVVVIALLVTATTRFIPLGATLYVGAVAGLLALWPLAHSMWTPTAEPAQAPRAVPAT
jgi:hypothetical protein